MPDTPPHTGKVRARIRSALMARRSTLFVWMLKNHRTFAADKALTGGVFSWEDVANALGDEGLLDGEGKRPNARTTEATWSKVCKAVAARNSKKRKEPPRAKDPAPSMVREVAPSITTAPNLPPPLLTTNRPAEKKYKFGPARFRTDEEQQAYDTKQRAEAEQQLAATRERLKSK